MSNLSALRLYFYYYARVKRKSFWQQLTAPSLSHYLASRAKAFGIGQVMVYRISEGFLPGDPLTNDLSEIPPKLPHCIELIDSEGMLRLFIEENQDELKDVRIALFRCEELFPEWLWLDEIKGGSGIDDLWDSTQKNA